jgi:acetyl esterase/lipase
MKYRIVNQFQTQPISITDYDSTTSLSRGRKAFKGFRFFIPVKLFFYISVISLFTFLSPCSAQDDKIPVVPPEVTAHLDTVYAQRGANRPMKLNLYLPPGAAPKPLVIWIHGGGWRMGSYKDWIHPLFLASHGYAVASIEYRLSKEAVFPAQIEDCKAAVRFLRANAKTYNLDPERFAASGESAGGNLAAMLGTTGGLKELTDAPEDPASDRVQAVIDLCGPADLTLVPDAGFDVEGTVPFFVYKLLGHTPSERPDLAQAASPVYHLSAQAPPFLILHAQGDPLCPVAQSQALYAALQKAGISSELIVVPVSSHVGPFFWTDAMHEKMVSFLQKALQLPSSPK